MQYAHAHMRKIPPIIHTCMYRALLSFISDLTMADKVVQEALAGALTKVLNSLQNTPSSSASAQSNTSSTFCTRTRDRQGNQSESRESDSQDEMPAVRKKRFVQY